MAEWRVTDAERNYWTCGLWLAMVIFAHIAFPAVLWLAVVPIFGLAHFGAEIYRENVEYYGR